MAAEAHSVTKLDTTTFIGNRRMVLATLAVTNYNGTTGGSLITAGELGISRIIAIYATDASALFEAFVVESTSAVRFRVATTGAEVADNVNISTTAPIAANLLIIGV